jgi:hypothetical protein
MNKITKTITIPSNIIKEESTNFDEVNEEERILNSSNKVSQEKKIENFLHLKINNEKIEKISDLMSQRK